MARKPTKKRTAARARKRKAEDVRKSLSIDALVNLVREGAEKIPDYRPPGADISLPDAVMSAFAIVSLEDPSLLAFDERRNDENLKTAYQIENIPCATHPRTILDPLDPESLRPLFKDVFRQLQRGKVLEPLVFHEGCCLLSLDGTGYFSSHKVHCPSCTEKTSWRGVAERIESEAVGQFP